MNLPSDRLVFCTPLLFTKTTWQRSSCEEKMLKEKMPNANERLIKLQVSYNITKGHDVENIKEPKSDVRFCNFISMKHDNSGVLFPVLFIQWFSLLVAAFKHLLNTALKKYYLLKTCQYKRNLLRTKTTRIKGLILPPHWICCNVIFFRHFFIFCP